MSLEKSEALVIRQADFSETSRVMTFFTREFGKLSMVAKGARRIRGPFQGALDLLATCNIVFIHKSNTSLDLLTEASLVRRFQPAAGAIHSLYGGYYVAELLDSLTEEQDPSPPFYEAAQITLARLSSGQSVLSSIVHFELIVLQELGQLPEFDRCVRCEGPLPQRGRVAFKVSQGGFLCANCEGDSTLISQHCDSSVPPLLAELSQQALDSSPLPIDPARTAEIRRILTACIAQILGRKPNTARYLPF